jgi:GNAT superfamily N-acetyltransferase
MRQQPFASPEEALEHHGVKGQKWGVRKEKPPKIQSFFQESIVGRTKNGDEFSVIPVDKQNGRLMQALARRFEGHRKLVENSALMDIRDKKGASIGNAQVYRKSKDELNLVWLDIEKSHRGQGYAQAVMRSARDLGGEHGFKKLTLEVPGVSPDARHIYEKMGFTVTKTPKTTKDVWGGLTHMEYNFDN